MARVVREMLADRQTDRQTQTCLLQYFTTAAVGDEMTIYIKGALK